MERHTDMRKVSAHWEQAGKAAFESIRLEAGYLAWTDLIILKSAASGKIEWNELPDKLRAAFVNVAVGAVTGHTKRL